MERERPLPRRLDVGTEPERPLPRRRHAVRITERDRRLLEFAAEHRLVLTEQLAALLGITTSAASARARALCASGYLESDRKVHGKPAYHQVTRQGLRAIGSDLAQPRRPDLAAYRHDVGVGWLMLAARGGVFGPWRQIVSERRMRSHDPRAERESEPFGIRAGGLGAGGGPRRHYPDLLMVTGTGHRVAFELELTSKSRRRREDILAAYAADPRISAVVYLVDDPSVGRAITASARRLGISGLVRVGAVQWTSEPGAGAPRNGERVVGRVPAARERPHDAASERAS
jgi:hypothetical protein